MTSPTYLGLAKTFCINAESQTLSFFGIYLHFKSKWTPINSREISDKTTIQSDYLLVMTKSKGEFLPFWDIHLHWKNQNEPLINSGDYTVQKSFSLTSCNQWLSIPRSILTFWMPISTIFEKSKCFSHSWK